MKLTKRGYIIKKDKFSVEEIKSIKSELTVSPFVLNDFGVGPEKRFSNYLESPHKLYLPRFYGINQFGGPTTNTLSGETIKCGFKGQLRDIQKPIIEICMKQLQETGGGILSLKCGGGKTVLALWILCQLKVKAIVIVHKEFLMTQWYDRIKEFIPTAKIGKIQATTIDIDGKDIVLGMVQSLSMKDYEPKIFECFGLAIFDECHHLGAEVFSKSMPKVASKYMLGLSATPNRKDGLRKVFEWYIGPMAYSTTEKNKDFIEVDIHNYYNEDPKYSKIINTIRGKPCYPLMINNICEFTPRTNIIIQKIIELYKEGRDILCLSDRRNHLKEIHDGLLLNKIDAGYYIGGMKPEELKKSQEKQVILGTFSMASEGMDIPKLNSIILGSPKSDIEQSVGRILRQTKDKRVFHPYIFDINDDFSIFKNQGNKRLKYYNKQNYNISTIKNGIKNIYVKKSKSKSVKDITVCLID